MTIVRGNTTQQPSGPYWYWTELGPENVNLADSKADLPAGRYEVLWDFRGSPGETLEFEIATTDGTVLLSVSRTIPSGNVDDWGSQFFSVP